MQTSLILKVGDIVVPHFFYGTAWKEEQTAPLTLMALNAGFRAIDTANQRKHYFEAAAGEAIATFLDTSSVKRSDLFLQTKFTFAEGQDHRLPYDIKAPTNQQVKQSFKSSLEHLRTDYVDCYMLHGPMLRHGLTDEDWQAWQAMEQLQISGHTRLLGVSNVSEEQLRLLCTAAQIKPAFVQNRCYARLGWDKQVRQVCQNEGIIYQGFSQLTANQLELRQPQVLQLAAHLGCGVAPMIFRFAQNLGMVTLTGTSQRQHMEEDLASAAINLSDANIALLLGH